MFHTEVTDRRYVFQRELAGAHQPIEQCEQRNPATVLQDHIAYPWLLEEPPVGRWMLNIELWTFCLLTVSGNLRSAPP